MINSNAQPQNRHPGKFTGSDAALLYKVAHEDKNETAAHPT
jgi:hypothetical protein